MTNQKNVGWVRPEAVTHQTETVGYVALTHPTVSLGEVCKTTSGGTPSRKNPDYFIGSIPWVKSGELPDGPVIDVEESISEKALRDSSAKLFPAGTLLIALYGATVGKLGILTKAAATNQAVCAIFPPPEIDTKFLFWFLRFRRSDLVAQAVGGAQPNISQGIIRNLEIPVPPLDQQKRIVAEIEKQFSRLDEAVANLKRVKANLKRYKAAVLKAAVEGRLVETEAELARREGRSLPTPRPGVFYVYAIRCNDDSIYIGHTDNLARRWEEHLAGQAADWTKQHKPIQIVHYEEYTSRQEAADREKWLKTGYGRKWIKREIEAGRARQVGYETGAQLLQRILETRRQQWLARAEQAGGKGKGKYKEATVPDTTDLPELPEGWVWATVGSLGDVIGGLTKNPKRAKLKRRLPYLRVANVYANELRLEEIEEIGVEDNELEKLLVQKGDLLVVEGNGSPEQIGRLAIWDGSISPCVHQNHLIKGVCKNNCVTGFSLTAASARRTGS